MSPAPKPKNPAQNTKNLTSEASQSDVPIRNAPPSFRLILQTPVPRGSLKSFFLATIFFENFARLLRLVILPAANANRRAVFFPVPVNPKGGHFAVAGFRRLSEPLSRISRGFNCFRSASRFNAF